jgi:uncharacterized protein (TIGR02271 family)
MATSNVQGNRIIAFFSKKQDAYRAISDLKDAGFSADEIGLVSRGHDTETGGAGTASSGTTGYSQHEDSFWDKIKNFFSGDDSDSDYADYSDTSAGMNWNQDRADYYYRGVGQGGALVSVTGARAEEARRILQNAGGDLRESGFTTDTESSRRGEGDREEEYRMQLRGEVLRAYRERVQRGEVTLRREVVTENQTVEVPVTREELVIERTAGSGQPGANAGEIGTDKEIRVPLSEERARVEKQPVVNEEVRVGKRAVQSTERVSDDVRHEELRVDNDENVKVDNRTSSKGKKPAA